MRWAVGNDVPPEHVGGEGCLTVAMFLLQEAEAMIQKIKQQQYADLLCHDQLLMERKEQKVFLHFGKNCHPPQDLSSHPQISSWGGGGKGRIMPGGEGNLARCKM